MAGSDRSHINISGLARGDVYKSGKPGVFIFGTSRSDTPDPIYARVRAAIFDYDRVIFGLFVHWKRDFLPADSVSMPIRQP